MWIQIQDSNDEQRQDEHDNDDCVNLHSHRLATKYHLELHNNSSLIQNYCTVIIVQMARKT